MNETLDTELLKTQESIRATRRANRERRQKERDDATQKKLSGESVAPAINIDAIKEPPKKSWQDRILSNFSGDNKEEKVDTKRAIKTQNLISHVLPLAISGMLAVYSQRLFREEYKKCAPTKEEVSSILLPVFSIIARHAEIEGKVSQDVIDAATALMAAITVTTRMGLTAMELRTGQNERATNSTDNNVNGNPNPNSQAESNTNIRAYHGTNGTKKSVIAGRSEYDGSDGYVDGSFDANDDRTWAINQVANLMRKDRIGRASLGLAPRIRDED